MEANRETYFPATMPGWMKLTTYVLGFGLGLVVPTIVAITIIYQDAQFLALIIPFVCATVLFAAYLFRPKGYEVDYQNNQLLIHRPKGPLRLPFADILGVVHPPKFNWVGTIGLFRSAGFFGIYGIFWNKRFGRFTAYATNIKQVVVIKKDNGRYILISPDEPQRFVDTLIQMSKAQGADISLLKLEH